MTYLSPLEALQDIFKKIIPKSKVYTDLGLAYEDFLSKYVSKNDVYISFIEATPNEYNSDLSYDLIIERFVVYIRDTDITNRVIEIYYSLTDKKYKNFALDNNGDVINCTIKNSGGSYIKDFDNSYFALNIDLYI